MPAMLVSTAVLVLRLLLWRDRVGGPEVGVGLLNGHDVLPFSEPGT